MSVYLLDNFTGTAGSLLTAHTSDSGATWPNDTNHSNSANGFALDGNGGVYVTVATGAVQISSAAMPSSPNFEVLYTLNRLTAIAATTFGVAFFMTMPGSSNNWKLYYVEGLGFAFYNGPNPVTGYVAGPAVGSRWWLKVDVKTLAGNTTFTAWYATTSGGAWNPLLTYTTATPTSPINVGLFNPSPTASTASTGLHVGNLIVRDIPIVPAPIFLACGRVK